MVRILVALFCLVPLLSAEAASIDELRRLFDYDAKAPLDAKESWLSERNKVRLYELNYASPKGGRVTGYLLSPSGEGPYAGIVFGHWGPGNRTEFLPEAQLFAEAGAVCVLIDYPWTRPAPWRRPLADLDNPEADREAYIQAVVDLRRAFDLLSGRADLDPRRLAYIGHSFGAQWGAILSAIEDRVQAAVLAGGIPDLASIYLESDEPAVVSERQKRKQDVEKYLRVNESLNAVNYVPHAAPTPLLFQFARFERYFNEAAMKRYAAAASEPKHVLWYDTGHELNDIQALTDRAAFLEPKLRLKPMRPLIEKRLKPALK